MNKFLMVTDFFDYDHPNVIKFTEEHTKNINSQKEKAISLFYAVRDEIRYNPYSFVNGFSTFKASFCLESNEAYCIPKAVLLGTCARLIGIPARLGLADVRNHLASEKLLEFLQSDIFTTHGYTELLIDGKWVKATAVFNKELCEKFGVKPLEFDGENDSIMHEFDKEGRKHMEYITDHGTFADVPVKLIAQCFNQHYPHLVNEFKKLQGLSFGSDKK